MFASYPSINCSAVPLERQQKAHMGESLWLTREPVSDEKSKLCCDSSGCLSSQLTLFLSSVTSPLTLMESQMTISAEIQLETLSAYVSSCWRYLSDGVPSHDSRLLPSAGGIGWDTFLEEGNTDGGNWYHKLYKLSRFLPEMLIIDFFCLGHWFCKNDIHWLEMTKCELWAMLLSIYLGYKLLVDSVTFDTSKYFSHFSFNLINWYLMFTYPLWYWL